MKHETPTSAGNYPTPQFQPINTAGAQSWILNHHPDPDTIASNHEQMSSVFSLMESYAQEVADKQSIEFAKWAVQEHFKPMERTDKYRTEIFKDLLTKFHQEHQEK